MLLVIGVVVVLLVVVTLAVLALQEPTTYDASTPEGVAQRYVQAVIDRDEDAAAGYLDDDQACDEADLRLAYVPESIRIVLRETRIDGDGAEVDLAITQGGGLGAGFTEEATLVMASTPDGWRISEPPWPMYYCEDVP